MACEFGERRLLVGWIDPLVEGVVEGTDAEFGDKTRGRFQYAALVECVHHGLGKPDALEGGDLYRLALEKAPAGSQLYAAAEECITVQEIAETIGRHLNVPAVSIPAEQAADHFKGFPFILLDITKSNADASSCCWTGSRSTPA
ncbi:hypothetical protein [Streptomyces sp. HUAS TT20]|uniref:hypothetical protein n=1 Tax=Streptomyces sp. HUAS TT20 TaxID=3447509 RepID=UPI0021D95E11|nr:hypothetical protein [Streptomyces sp. HUAS 15-9]UXY27394.1 hypothetical protein N8I87_12875 [Streptomyces sp. HUAS 15-9]